MKTSMPVVDNSVVVTKGTDSPSTRQTKLNPHRRRKAVLLGGHGLILDRRFSAYSGAS
jgi:hypothetical protein